MTQKEFINILVKRGIPRDKITIENGLINLDGDVHLSSLKLTKIPYPFGVVTGDFIFRNNQLTTLEGAPKKVGGGFWCHQNLLFSFKWSLKRVFVNFNLDYDRKDFIINTIMKYSEVKGNIYV